MNGRFCLNCNLSNWLLWLKGLVVATFHNVLQSCQGSPIFLNLLHCSQIFPSAPQFSHIPPNIPEYFPTFQNKLKYSQGSQRLSNFLRCLQRSKIFSNLPKSFLVFLIYWLDSRLYVYMYIYIYRYITCIPTFPHMLPIFPNVLKSSPISLVSNMFQDISNSNHSSLRFHHVPWY